MPNVLIENDGKDYSGKYVATASFSNKAVIASDEDPDKVYDEARLKGFTRPVIFFVPKKNTVYIY